MLVARLSPAASCAGEDMVRAPRAAGEHTGATTPGVALFCKHL